MDQNVCQKPTRKQSLQCLGWGLFIVVAIPFALILSIPALIAKWIVERRDGFTVPTPEQAAEFSRRLLTKTKTDTVTVDGQPHPISWIQREEENPAPNVEIHTTDDWTFRIDTDKFVVTRMFPKWWFAKVDLRVNYKDVA